MDKISYSEFKKNPLLYLLFLPLIAMVTLFYLNKKADERRQEDKDALIIELRTEIKQLKEENKQLTIDNKQLYEAFIVKRTLDTLSKIK